MGDQLSVVDYKCPACHNTVEAIPAFKGAVCMRCRGLEKYEKPLYAIGDGIQSVLETEIKSPESAEHVRERESVVKLEQELAAKKAEAERLKQSIDLPPGWSADYDPVKQKVFFVDHVFKRSQWSKPVLADEVKEIVPKADQKSRTYFISYKQQESKDLALDLWHGLGGNKNPGAWLDVKNYAGQTVDDMKAGIRECKYFLLILTEGYFDSAYCRLELNYAIDLGKEAIMVFNTDRIAKQSIGKELTKAKEHGIDLCDWPSALPISTDVNLFQTMLGTILKMKPKKLVRNVQ